MEVAFEKHLDVPRERLFEFHTHPENLALLLEGWRGFELLAHEGHIRPGARVTVRQCLGPLRFRMTFEHSLLDAPNRFGERMVSGPFTRFEHVHEFRASGASTTLVDRLSFELPLRLGGLVADHGVVAPFLRRFWAFRHAAYERLIAEGRIGRG